MLSGDTEYGIEWSHHLDPQLIDDEPADRHYRWHCIKCGRFVPFATVHKLPMRTWEDDDEWRGTCKTHGENVDVVWGQQ